MYGGTILPGHCPGQDTALDAQSVIEVCIPHHDNHNINITTGNRLLWSRADGY